MSDIRNSVVLDDPTQWMPGITPALSTGYVTIEWMEWNGDPDNWAPTIEATWTLPRSKAIELGAAILAGTGTVTTGGNSYVVSSGPLRVQKNAEASIGLSADYVPGVVYGTKVGRELSELGSRLNWQVIV